MTNREAFELMVKYGDEDSIVKIQAMLYAVGIERTKVSTILSFKEKQPDLSDEFITFLCQGIDYIHEEMNQAKT